MDSFFKKNLNERAWLRENEITEQFKPTYVDKDDKVHSIVERDLVIDVIRLSCFFWESGSPQYLKMVIYFNDNFVLDSFS